MRWTRDAVVTLAEIDAIRSHRKTDQLTRFTPMAPAAILTLSLSVIALGAFTLADNGVTFSTLFSQTIIIAGKTRSIAIYLVLLIFFVWLGGWMAILLVQWGLRGGRPPLAVNDQSVTFNGRDFARSHIRHFEQQHWGIHGVFAIILHDGQIFRMPNAFMIGAPVREWNAKTKAAVWSEMQGPLMLQGAAALVGIGLLLILLLT